MAIFLLPLIQIYTKGINDANYTNALLVILFVVMNLLANGKLPSNHVLEYSGKFEETRSHAIWEMIINDLKPCKIAHKRPFLLFIGLIHITVLRQIKIVFVMAYYFIVRTIFSPAFYTFFSYLWHFAFPKPTIVNHFWNTHALFLHNSIKFLNAPLKNIKFTPIYKGTIQRECIIPFISSLANESQLKPST